jgi:hypothetical protein
MRKTAPQPVTEIDLVKLKAIVNRLLEHVIETRGIRTVALDKPYYWEVPAEGRYELEAEPGALDVGNLADDWEFLSALLRSSEQPVAYQLTELAPLLDYVGQALADELGPTGG